MAIKTRQKRKEEEDAANAAAQALQPAQPAQPAQPPPQVQRPTRRGAGTRKPKDGRQPDPPADDPDDEENLSEQETGGEQPLSQTADEAPGKKNKRKRPTPAASPAGSKASGSGAAGPSKRPKVAKTKRPAQNDDNEDENEEDEEEKEEEDKEEDDGNDDDNDVEVPAKGKAKGRAKGKGRGKGKGKAAVSEDDSQENSRPVGFVAVDRSDGGPETQGRMKNNKAGVQLKWSESIRPALNSHTWRGAQNLGSGAFGSANVWYCTNENGTIHDRVVAKDTCIGRRDQWRDWARWWGNPRIREEREHMEIKIMEDMRSQAKESRCVVLRGSAHFDDQWTYRILMTYCPLGSLADAIPPMLEKEPFDLTEVFNDEFDVPESLVWKWLEDLAIACRLLHEGKDLIEVYPGQQTGQHVIVHRDIKPGNVFLDLPDEESDWPTYPIATLGDFGSSIYTRDDDPDNPMAYNYWEGTPGFRPVEMVSLLDSNNFRPIEIDKLGSATNIWGIGASIMALCNRTQAPEMDYRYPQSSVPTFNANARVVYSDELRKLVQRCVEYLPEHRISVTDLLEATSRHTAGPVAGPEDDDLANGMRAGNPTSDDIPVEWESIVKEFYKIGSTPKEARKNRAAEFRKCGAELQRKIKAAKEAQKARKAAAARAKREADAAKRKAAADAKKEAAAAKKEAAAAKRKTGKK